MTIMQGKKNIRIERSLVSTATRFELNLFSSLSWPDAPIASLLYVECFGEGADRVSEYKKQYYSLMNCLNHKAYFSNCYSVYVESSLGAILEPTIVELLL